MSNKQQGHRERLRNKFLRSSIDSFNDYEIIELLLTLATPRKDCKAPAKELLKKFKNLQGVFEATVFDLKKTEGVGEKNIFGIKFIKAISDKYLKEKALNQNVVSNPKAFFDFLNSYIRDKKKESFICAFLNSSNKIIAIETLFEGTVSKSAVYPNEVIKKIIEHSATAVIFAHNHPSGKKEASVSDIAITKKLFFACKFIDVNVYDHIIVTPSGHYSFAESGYINAFDKNFKEKDL